MVINAMLKVHIVLVIYDIYTLCCFLVIPDILMAFDTKLRNFFQIYHIAALNIFFVTKMSFIFFIFVIHVYHCVALAKKMANSVY